MLHDESQFINGAELGYFLETIVLLVIFIMILKYSPHLN